MENHNLYITDQSCECCESKLTSDEVQLYESWCYSCCSKAWENYEIAHGGECKLDIKRVPVTEKLKEYIKLRDKVCLGCGSDKNLTIDHIIPVSKGGDNHHSNLQLLCVRCNSVKWVYPQDFREVIEL